MRASRSDRYGVRAAIARAFLGMSIVLVPVAAEACLLAAEAALAAGI
jgi:hypothetical protein